VASGYAQATRPLSCGAPELVLPSTPMSTAGITATVLIATRRVRVERFLIVGGRWAARRLNIA